MIWLFDFFRGFRGDCWPGRDDSSTLWWLFCWHGRYLWSSAGNIYLFIYFIRHTWNLLRMLTKANSLSCCLLPHVAIFSTYCLYKNGEGVSVNVWQKEKERDTEDRVSWGVISIWHTLHQPRGKVFKHWGRFAQWYRRCVCVWFAFLWRKEWHRILRHVFYQPRDWGCNHIPSLCSCSSSC